MYNIIEQVAEQQLTIIVPRINSPLY